MVIVVVVVVMAMAAVEEVFAGGCPSVKSGDKWGCQLSTKNDPKFDLNPFRNICNAI